MSSGEVDGHDINEVTINGDGDVQTYINEDGYRFCVPRMNQIITLKGNPLFSIPCECFGFTAKAFRTCFTIPARRGCT